MADTPTAVTCRCWVCGDEFEPHPSALLSEPRPRYCQPRCRKAAYYSKFPCVGCGGPSVRPKMRLMWCDTCLELLRSHCLRKRRYTTATEAPGAVADGQTLYPYDCRAGCGGVHTSSKTGELVPGDYDERLRALATRLRAVGFDLEAARSRKAEPADSP